MRATAAVTHRVRREDSAQAWGNDLPVLATPVLLWLSEIATMKAIEDGLPDGFMTVGAAHDNAHLATTLTGEEAMIRATLTSATGRSLLLEVEASGTRGPIPAGRHRRGLVRNPGFVLSIGHGRKNDDADALSVGVAALTSRTRNTAETDGQTTALRAIVDHR
jgi:fluoroacetyl-CoA thioesterase